MTSEHKWNIWKVLNPVELDHIAVSYTKLHYAFISIGDTVASMG